MPWHCIWFICPLSICCILWSNIFWPKNAAVYCSSTLIPRMMYHIFSVSAGYFKSLALPVLQQLRIWGSILQLVQFYTFCRFSWQIFSSNAFEYCDVVNSVLTLYRSLLSKMGKQKRPLHKEEFYVISLFYAINTHNAYYSKIWVQPSAWQNSLIILVCTENLWSLLGGKITVVCTTLMMIRISHLIAPTYDVFRWVTGKGFIPQGKNTSSAVPYNTGFDSYMKIFPFFLCLQK